MALLLVDSFDGYTTITQKWPTNTSGNGSIGAYGRFSTNGLRMPGSRWCQMRSITAIQTVYVGVAAKYSSSAVSMAPILLWDTVNNVQVMVSITYWGKVRAYRGWGDAVLAESTLSMGTITSWHYYELKAKISNSVGQIIFRVDGVEFINTAANLDTSRSGNEYTNMIGLNHSLDNVGLNCDYDDFYFDDAQFHGDCQVICRSPSGAGNYTQWTPSAGNNYACVDEAAPDTADYVSTAVKDNIDSYAMNDISPSSGTVKAVAGSYYCQRDNAGPRILNMLTRLSSTDLVSDRPQVMPTSWGFLQFVQETKPGGGSWSVQDTKDAEMGMKLEV